jgi:hypothetical protein
MKKLLSLIKFLILHHKKFTYNIAKIPKINYKEVLIFLKFKYKQGFNN